MTRVELQECLENALQTVLPAGNGWRGVTGYEGDRYVACNRLGYRGSPRMVYKLANKGKGVELSFLISSTDRRVRTLEELFAKKQVGVEVCYRRGDVYIPSGEICATAVAEMVKKFYDAYEINLCR